MRRARARPRRRRPGWTRRHRHRHGRSTHRRLTSRQGATRPPSATPPWSCPSRPCRTLPSSARPTAAGRAPRTFASAGDAGMRPRLNVTAAWKAATQSAVHCRLPTSCLDAARGCRYSARDCCRETYRANGTASETPRVACSSRKTWPSSRPRAPALLARRAEVTPGRAWLSGRGTRPTSRRARAPGRTAQKVTIGAHCSAQFAVVAAQASFCSTQVSQ